MRWPWEKAKVQPEPRIDAALVQRLERWADTLSEAADDLSDMVERMRENELSQGGTGSE